MVSCEVGTRPRRGAGRRRLSARRESARASLADATHRHTKGAFKLQTTFWFYFS